MATTPEKPGGIKRVRRVSKKVALTELAGAEPQVAPPSVEPPLSVMSKPPAVTRACPSTPCGSRQSATCNPGSLMFNVSPARTLNSAGVRMSLGV